MDRHDAKPRRPSLLAGADAQHLAAGPRPARILAEPGARPARRRSRRPRHLRAALACLLALASLATLAWTFVVRDAPAVAPLAGPPASPAFPPPAAAPATLVDIPTAPGRPARNPFDGPPVPSGPVARAAAVPVVPSEYPAQAGAAPAANPFHEPAPALAPKPPRQGAAAPTLPPPDAVRTVTSVRAGPAPAPTSPLEPGLLQALMDNIQPPPARHTAAMDRLTRQLDRTPMPAVAVAPGAPPDDAMLPASVRAQVVQCPATRSLHGQRCRRQLCERAGLDPRRCTRH